MDMTQLIVLIAAAVLILGLVAFKILWAGSHAPAGFNRWIPAKLRRWLRGESGPKPTH
jgi:hypothetical protein